MKNFLVLLALTLSSSCSEDGPEPGCYRDEGRSIVETVTEISGNVTLGCGSTTTYIFEPDSRLDKNPTGVLVPCNLSEEFKMDGLRINFSGYIYESFETEDICADFFEITDIQIEGQN